MESIKPRTYERGVSGSRSSQTCSHSAQKNRLTPNRSTMTTGLGAPGGQFGQEVSWPERFSGSDIARSHVGVRASNQDAPCVQAGALRPFCTIPYRRQRRIPICGAAVYFVWMGYSALSFAIFALAVSVTRSMAAYRSFAWPFSLSASDFRLAAAPAFRSCPR